MFAGFEDEVWRAHAVLGAEAAQRPPLSEILVARGPVAGAKRCWSEVAPPSGVDDLASVLRPQSDGGTAHITSRTAFLGPTFFGSLRGEPRSDGACGPRALLRCADTGVLEQRGMVEVVSSLARDGSPVPRDLRWGVYVTFAAHDEYVRRCFKEYGLTTDESGVYASMYKPFHLIGLELGVSVASAGVRGEPTGAPTGWRADVAAVAKRELHVGEALDGEGGFTVWGKCVPATSSLSHGALPLGLAHGCTVRRRVAAGSTLSWEDVEFEGAGLEEAIRLRREMELYCPALY